MKDDLDSARASASEGEGDGDGDESAGVLRFAEALGRLAGKHLAAAGSAAPPPRGAVGPKGAAAPRAIVARRREASASKRPTSLPDVGATP